MNPNAVQFGVRVHFAPRPKGDGWYGRAVMEDGTIVLAFAESDEAIGFVLVARIGEYRDATRPLAKGPKPTTRRERTRGER